MNTSYIRAYADEVDVRQFPASKHTFADKTPAK
jgi:ketopantoate hydroxymethyltransferase